MDFDHVISTKNLKKTYKGSDEEALKGIDLNIRSGDFFGLLGPNAAGKSTLIAILCGILESSSGEVNVFGEKISSRSNNLKSKIGLIPQEIALYQSLSVIENMYFFGRMYGLSGRKLVQRVEECIKVFYLAEHRNKIISRCSGGIKRRVNLIAGIMHNPSLIMLDEPTLGVDPQLRSLIFDYLTALNKSGSTIIYTTHYMKEAEMLCNRVGIIDHGIIIRDGSPAELIAAAPGCNDLGQVFIQHTGRDLRD